MEVSMKALTALNYLDTDIIDSRLRVCMLNILPSSRGHYIQIKHILDQWDFYLCDLESMYIQSIGEGYLVLFFKQPLTQIILNNDYPSILINFVNGINESVRSLGLVVNIYKDFIPLLSLFISNVRYVRDMSKIDHLSTVILEGCILPSLTLQFGDLPISHLSLNGSTLGTSQYEQDIFWNWMSKDNISDTLKTLEMNSVNLKVLPFEIMFLKKLQTLSLVNNKLKFIPHIIGELKELENFFVNINMLSYLPECLIRRPYKNFNCYDIEFLPDSSFLEVQNREHEMTIEKRKSGKPICPTLSDLSIFSIINNGIKLKRQNIPRSLWCSFEKVSRCLKCRKKIMAQNCIENFDADLMLSPEYPRNVSILWQSFVCSYECKWYL